MMMILRANSSRTFSRRPFQIRRIRPGTILGPDADLAFGPLSVIDHAHLAIGTVVAMHEHNNDEILSYLWRGSMVHQDSAGHRIVISPEKLMMMNAGASFWHEESTPDTPVEMLQIFVRPREADLPGMVQFHDRPTARSRGRWHLIGGPESGDAPLKIRQQVVVYEAHLEAGQEVRVPGADGMTPWLYVMDGSVSVGDSLRKGDAVTDLEEALPMVRAESASTLVAFLVDRSAPASTAGTISGK